MDPKRKLRILPEVLPTPGPAPTSRPRERTVARMRTLLAAAATTSAAFGCSRREAEAPIGPDPKGTIKKIEKEDEVVNVKDAATPLPDPTDDPGYGVVDPMPPPPECPGLAATVKATVAWKTDPSGKYVELLLPKPTMSGSEWVKSVPPTAYGGKITKHGFTGSDVYVRVVPDAGSTYAYVYVAAKCSTGEERVYATVDLSSGSPKVTLNDISR